MNAPMNAYNVVLVRVPRARADAISQITEVFGIDATEASSLLESLPRVVKQGVPLEVAERFERAFQSMGALCQLEPSPPSTPVPSPVQMSAVPERLPRASSAPRRMVHETAPVRFARASTPASATATHEARRSSSIVALPPSSEPRLEPPSRRWMGALVVVAIAIAATVLYFKLRAPRMGGLVVHQVGGGGRATPALVLLHGFGAPGDDLVALGKELAATLPDIQIIAAEGRVSFRGNRAWWKTTIEEAHASRAAVSALIDELIDEGTPPEMIIVAGFSQGAILAMDVALNHPRTLGGVAMLSGTREPRFDWDSLMEGRQDLSIFISHGRADGVLSFRTAETLVTDLTAHNYTVDFVPFAGGHSIPPEIRNALADFVASQL